MKKSLIAALMALSTACATDAMNAPVVNSAADIQSVVSQQSYQRMQDILRNPQEKQHCISEVRRIVAEVKAGNVSNIDEELIQGSGMTPLYFCILGGYGKWKNELRHPGPHAKVSASVYERITGVHFDTDDEKTCIRRMGKIMDEINAGDVSNINTNLVPGITPLFYSILFGCSEWEYKLRDAGATLSAAESQAISQAIAAAANNG